MKSELGRKKYLAENALVVCLIIAADALGYTELALFLGGLFVVAAAGILTLQWLNKYNDKFKAYNQRHSNQWGDKPDDPEL